MGEEIIDKNISKKIQGIAVFMMIIHHAFGFPERYLPGISYIGIPIGGGYLETFIGSMCKICVSIFAFGTGYGLAYKTVDLKYIKGKISSLICIYWISLALFILCGLIGGTTYDLIDVMENILLVKTDLNHAAWYLPFYFLVLFTIPFFQRANFTFTKLMVFSVACWGMNYLSLDVWTPISNYFIYMPVVLSGHVCARSSTVKNMISKIADDGIQGTVLSALVLAIVLGFRIITGAEWNGFRFIWVYAPSIYMTFSVLVKSISKIKICNWIMNFFGRYSTYFWLTHALFTSKIYWTQFIGFLPKISVLILVWQVIILTCVARAFMFLVIKRRNIV